jgi:hypothetical protein
MTGPNIASDGAWNLPPTLQEAFNQHQPNAMFSDASSTIPNTIVTDHQLYQDYHAPQLSALPGSWSREIGEIDKVKSSLNWSEIMQSQMAVGISPWILP